MENETNLDKSALDVVNEIVNKYQVDKKQLNTIEKRVFLAIYYLNNDSHIYIYDKYSNDFNGKRLDFKLASELAKKMLIANKINFDYEINGILNLDNETISQIDSKQKTNYYSPIEFKAIKKVTGKDNSQYNFEIKKQNFWTAFKEYQKGNLSGLKGLKKYAHLILSDENYNLAPKSKYHDLYESWNKKYEADKLKG